MTKVTKKTIVKNIKATFNFKTPLNYLTYIRYISLVRVQYTLNTDQEIDLVTRIQ